MASRKTAVATGTARPQVWSPRPCSICDQSIAAAADGQRVRSIYWLETGARRMAWRWQHRRCA
jgi:hypothetical protein